MVQIQLNDELSRTRCDKTLTKPGEKVNTARAAALSLRPCSFCAKVDLTTIFDFHRRLSKIHQRNPRT